MGDCCTQTLSTATDSRRVRNISVVDRTKPLGLVNCHHRWWLNEYDLKASSRTVYPFGKLGTGDRASLEVLNITLGRDRNSILS